MQNLLTRFYLPFMFSPHLRNTHSHSPPKPAHRKTIPSRIPHRHRHRLDLPSDRNRAQLTGAHRNYDLYDRLGFGSRHLRHELPERELLGRRGVQV